MSVSIRAAGAAATTQRRDIITIPSLFRRGVSLFRPGSLFHETIQKRRGKFPFHRNLPRLAASAGPKKKRPPFRGLLGEFSDADRANPIRL
jgi:hypothetical protein